MKETDETAEVTGANAGQGVSRRGFVLGAAGAAAALGLGGAKFLPSTPVVRPPGGQDENLLLGGCIRCEKCYEICPRHVIKMAHIEDGILGMRTPQMVFDTSYCDFCTEENGGDPLCVKTCPTQALALPSNAEAATTIIGVAEIVTDWCLAYHLIGCRFCYDACPYEAIELSDSDRPRVLENKCNGCGACESVCVSLKEGSIAPGANTRAIRIKPIEK